MKAIDQTVVDAGFGDCARAVVASLLELELDQVPNFIKYKDSNWFDVYYYFFYSLGYKYVGMASPQTHKLDLEDSIDGYFDATVPSKTFEGKNHAVIVDINGIVVHDPNPNKRWQGINVLESGDLKYWYLYEKRNNG